MGGGQYETMLDAAILGDLGLIAGGYFRRTNHDDVRDAIKYLGYKYEMNDRKLGDFNKYYDKNGNRVLKRVDFWRGVAADHPELMKGKSMEQLLKGRS